MELKSLIEKIEQRPELFLGGRDIIALRHFLAGYLTAMQETQADYEDSLWENFTAFLARKYRDDRDFDWALLLISHEGKQKAFNAFFRLLKEYYAQR